MPEEIIYYKTTTEIILDLFKSWNNQFFTTLYDGDDLNMDIPFNELPAIVVDSQDTAAEQGPTATDNITETINIRVILDKSKYSEDFGLTTVGWKKKLVLLVQGTDPTTQYYDETTIFGILRTYFTLGNYAYNQTLRVKYGEVPKANNEARTGEAWITMVISRHQQTPNKQ